MVDAVRNGCASLLGGSELANVVLHSQVFTAVPLMETLRTMLATVFQEQ